MRTAAKRDAIEQNIVDALEAIGCSVQRISQKGLPDLLVGYRKRNFLIEVKSHGGKLTPLQQEFADFWRGQFMVAFSEDEALDLVTGAYEK